jgi:hypothetical protein
MRDSIWAYAWYRLDVCHVVFERMAGMDCEVVIECSTLYYTCLEKQHELALRHSDPDSAGDALDRANLPVRRLACL